MLIEPQNVKRLLFVDDERSILDGFRRSYRGLRSEFDIFFAESGAEALTLIDDQPMDVVVSDMRMPQMDGAELMVQIATQTPDTIRIILTGQADRESSLKALRVTHQFLSKPCKAEDLKAAIDQALAIRQRIHNPTIKAIVSGIANLPSTPQVVMELDDELQSSNPSAERVADIIATDIAMTAEILKVANSAFMGLGMTISSAKDAAVMLGVDIIKSLALYHSVQKAVVADPQVSSLSADGIFSHSLRVAALARHLTRLEGGTHQQRQDSFTAGLLHDIGKLLILQQPSAYRGILPLAAGTRFHEVEQERFGCSHAEVGAYVLALWKFPLPLVETIAFHHSPAECAHGANDSLAAVHVANAWSNDPAVTDNPYLDPAYIAAAGLAEKLPRWRQESTDFLIS